jgi:prepilin-type N-terminal cleavage/methylation domain-containing protein
LEICFDRWSKPKCAAVCTYRRGEYRLIFQQAARYGTHNSPSDPDRVQETTEIAPIQSSPRGGFTLLEVSMVLVVIGLIVGGVLVGKDMIRQAQLRSVMTSVEKYKTAVRTFQGKYGSLPGDLPNAATLFNICTDWAPACDITINGNDNGMIDWAEKLEFWHHLSLAGLIPNSIPGCPSCDGAPNAWNPVQIGGQAPGGNLPALTYDNNAGLSYYCTPNAYPTYINNDPSYEIYVQDGCFFLAMHGPQNGAPDITGGTQYNASQGIMSALEAQQFDNKFDDGIPSSGAILGAGGGDPLSCSNVNDYTASNPAEYNTNTNPTSCSMLFRVDF